MFPLVFPALKQQAKRFKITATSAWFDQLRGPGVESWPWSDPAPRMVAFLPWPGAGGAFGSRRHNVTMGDP